MVRKAEVEDVDKIHEKGVLINEKFPILFDMNKILKEEHSKVYVYEKEKEVIAFLHITDLYESVDIINIVVLPEFRRMGIASNLLDYMISELDSNKQLITLEVVISNESAINFYKKFDFEIINTRKSYYKGEDAYLMGKMLKV